MAVGVVDRVLRSLERSASAGRTVAIVSTVSSWACCAILLGEPVEMAWERIPENGGWQVVEVNGLEK
jgi:hypothetical protein